MPRNPSELQRLEEELASYRRMMKVYTAKAAKEMILVNIRKIEKQLGLPHKPYNKDG